MMHVPKLDMNAIREKFDALPQEEKDRIYAENKQRTQRMLDSWDAFHKAHPEIAESMMCAA